MSNDLYQRQLEKAQKRLEHLPFNYAIPDDQQDPYLGEKIWKERDAIVTKALRYARKLVQLNYIFPEIPQVDNVKCIVRDSIAKTVGKFIQESCDRSEPKAVTATEDLYNAYSDYCKEKNMCACSKKAFTQELTQRGIRRFQSERSKDQSSCSPADGTAKGNRTGQHARSHAELCWWADRMHSADRHRL